MQGISNKSVFFVCLFVSVLSSLCGAVRGGEWTDIVSLHLSQSFAKKTQNVI